MCVISPNSVAFATHCVKCLKIYVNFQRQEYSKKFTFAISSPDKFLSCFLLYVCLFFVEVFTVMVVIKALILLLVVTALLL